MSVEALLAAGQRAAEALMVDQCVIRRRTGEIKRQRRLEAPGYFLTYFPGQQGAFESAYLRAAMRPDAGKTLQQGHQSD